MAQPRYSIHELERMLKQAYLESEQEKANMADCCTQAPAPSSGLGSYGTQGGCEPQRPATRLESTLNRLDRTVYQATIDSEKAAKVHDILVAHPEFFDFLEVLESGLVR